MKPTNYHVPKLASHQEQEQLLERCNVKYKCLVLLMLDGGLRVTEVVRLQLKDFNFLENYVVIESLKKREKTKHRIVPLTTRLPVSYTHLTLPTILLV